MLSKERFLLLLQKYVSDEISAEERSELFAALSSGLYDDLLSEHIGDNLKADEGKGANIPPHRAAAMLHKILSSEKQNSMLLSVKSRRAKLIRWMAVAATIVVVLFSVYLLKENRQKDGVSNAAQSKAMKEFANADKKPIKIKLEDGSFVTLQPGSTVHYPTHFSSGKREVYLDGEAFFEVSKNPTSPFFVYNKNIVTRVLGTSFTVKLNKETQQVEVAVRTGKVEVYENNTEAKTNASSKGNGVILLPNQKVVYDEAGHQFVSSLVEKPLPVIIESNDKKKMPENTAFDETPLKAVFTQLEKSYGLEIIVENEAIYNCLFTGDVSQENLYARLDIVCQATGTSYEVKGTRILIKGKGCN